MRYKLAFVEIVFILLIIATSIFIMTVDIRPLAEKWGITPKEVPRVYQDTMRQPYRSKDFGMQPYRPKYKTEKKTTSSHDLSKIWDDAANGNPNAQSELFVIFIVCGGAILALIGKLLILIAAFGESVYWGFALFIFPGLAAIPFLIVHWDVSKRGFLLILLGSCIALIGFLIHGYFIHPYYISGG